MSCFGIFTYRATYFSSYDSLQAILFTDPKKGNPLTKFALAQASVIFAHFVSYPYDTVQRNLMVQSSNNKVIHSGAFDCIN